MGKALPLPPHHICQRGGLSGLHPSCGGGGEGREPSFPDVLGNSYWKRHWGWRGQEKTRINNFKTVPTHPDQHWAPFPRQSHAVLGGAAASII